MNFTPGLILANVAMMAAGRATRGDRAGALRRSLAGIGAARAGRLRLSIR